MNNLTYDEQSKTNKEYKESKLKMPNNGVKI